MSKKADQKIEIHNHINNSNTNNQVVENKDELKQESSKFLKKIALWIGVIASLITIYLFYENDIADLMKSDYDPKVEDIIGG